MDAAAIDPATCDLSVKNPKAGFARNGRRNTETSYADAYDVLTEQSETSGTCASSAPSIRANQISNRRLETSVGPRTWSSDFLDLAEEDSERELERSLVNSIRRFLAEMGGAFAFT